IVGVNHSHFFSFRLDMDVDGQANSLVVERLKTETQPASNPRRSVWYADPTVARTEADAQLHGTTAEPMIWRVVNPAVRGAAGDPVSYQISGDHSAMTLLLPEEYHQRRAGFTNHTLWATP